MYRDERSFFVEQSHMRIPEVGGAHTAEKRGIERSRVEGLVPPSLRLWRVTVSPMTSSIRRLVLDVLKPHEPSIHEFAVAVVDCPGVDGVNVVLVETDRDVQTLKFTIEGDDINLTAIEEAVDAIGGSVHSIDQVVCGERLIEQSRTPQDR